MMRMRHLYASTEGGPEWLRYVIYNEHATTLTHEYGAPTYKTITGRGVQARVVPFTSDANIHVLNHLKPDTTHPDYHQDKDALKLVFVPSFGGSNRTEDSE